MGFFFPRLCGLKGLCSHLQGEVAVPAVPAVSAVSAVRPYRVSFVLSLSTHPLPGKQEAWSHPPREPRELVISSLLSSPPVSGWEGVLSFPWKGLRNRSASCPPITAKSAEDHGEHGCLGMLETGPQQNLLELGRVGWGGEGPVWVTRLKKLGDTQISQANQYSGV